MERWNAEDVAAGDPLSGPDQLVVRILDAIAEAHDAGIDAGHDDAFDEGIDEALDGVVTALNAELDIEVELNATDDLGTGVDKIIEAIRVGQVEQFNRGVDALAAELDTKRAVEVAETIWGVVENT